MKKTVSSLLVAISAFGVLAFAAPSAEAQHRGHHGHHGARIGVFIGAPLAFAAWPYYRPYPYYDPYYSRPIVIQEQPVIYTEQAQGVPMAPPPPAPQAQAQAQQQYWYFCQDTQTYYPHVQNCATPWQRVIPQAPR